MQQQNLRQVVAEQGDRLLFVVVDFIQHVRHIAKAQAFEQGRALGRVGLAVEHVLVGEGPHPFAVVHRHRRDRVIASDQKIGNRHFVFRRAPRTQIRMAKPARPLLALREHRPQHAFAAHNRVFVGGNTDFMQIDMAVGVVAQFVTRIEPRFQHPHALGLHHAVEFEFVFVDETDHRHTALAQLIEQGRMPCAQSVWRGLRHALPRQIVDGDGDAAVWRLRRRGRGVGRHRVEDRQVEAQQQNECTH
jgi:hypothetical protein